MSTKLTGYVWDGCAASGMKLSSVAIMARLADFSSDEGVCWPSIETIARQLGAGPSTIRTAIAKLEKDGWLTRTQRRNGNRNASNVYRLNVAKLQAAAFSQLSDSDTSKSDASNFDASKTDPSKSGKNGGFDPSESGGETRLKVTRVLVSFPEEESGCVLDIEGINKETNLPVRTGDITIYGKRL